MNIANERNARAYTALKRPTIAAPNPCLAMVSDALPPQTRIMSVIRDELCPNQRCSDVDRAIIGASLGG